MATAPGIILAAASSGSGKTLLTLGLLAALRARGLRVQPAKIGPDYIDPAFHAAASGRASVTLDSWAMRPGTLQALAGAAANDADLVLCEGVMGLLDGADVTFGQPDGSTAEMAALTGWPVVLVVDASGMAASAAAIVAGFAAARPDVRVVGAIFNRVGSDKHRRMISAALARLCPGAVPLGFMPRLKHLAMPSRHLGLVQACEHPDLAAFTAAASQAVGDSIDLAALVALARPGRVGPGAEVAPIAPLGQRIAVADDAAFAFHYPATLTGWRQAGAEILPFSPLADQGPAEGCDAVYLPGGYPELYAGNLAGNQGFLTGVRRAATAGALVFGECGGYMVMGHTLVDADGTGHAMAGLLPVETSFAIRRRHLGYRQATLLESGPLGPAGQRFRGHEFHFATTIAEGGEHLFAMRDASGQDLAATGCRVGRAMGSFLHLIDRA